MAGRTFTDAELRERDFRIVRATLEYSDWQPETVPDVDIAAIIASADG